jgi:L-ascorbate metabolism protein UlaG (beta-lactamase superfamily)
LPKNFGVLPKNLPALLINFNMNIQFGNKATKALKQVYSKSENWEDEKFKNSEKTQMGIKFTNIPKLLNKMLFQRTNRKPKQDIPIIPFNKESFLTPTDSVKFVWYGHSVVLLRIGNKNILIDPMFGSNAAPIAPFAIKRFSTNTLQIIDDLPSIDAVLLTHDHYDHLDYKSIIKLKSKVSHYFVAMGIARHLEKWGINTKQIKEFDWWDTNVLDDIEISFTPSRHFSGRGVGGRDTSLWGGWAIKNKKQNIYYTGDGGYGKHFKEINEKLGPFDFTFVECGQYNENWHHIHMYPEESVQVAIDTNSKCIMPMHWAGFSLSTHPWNESVERFVKCAKNKQVNYIIPKLGEITEINSGKINSETWWKNIE